MILREPCLGPGWYPRQKNDIAAFLEGQLKDRNKAHAVSAVAPHAGWYYSGRPAALAVSSLSSKAETVAVIGGHLPRGMPVLIAEEDGVKTPLGVMEIDIELREQFKKQASPVSWKPDRYEDNTVEILLPMVHYFFPQAKLLWLRFPADLESFEAGKALAIAVKTLGRQINVLSSTDLTHYGVNYGFSPKGSGKPALEWMKNVNDSAFIGAVLNGDPSEVLMRAEKDHSACSAGAVLGALGFTFVIGKTKRELLDYRTSAELQEEIPDSFVGYAAIALG